MLAGGEEKIGKPVGLDPVGLLGHVVAVAAQARLDVEQRHPGGDRGAGAGDRGVGVAANEHRVGTLGLDHPSDPLLGDGDALVIGQRADPEVVFGQRQPAGRRSAGPTSPGRSAGRCGPGSPRRSSLKASESGAACTISGREPMMETIRGVMHNQRARRAVSFRAAEKSFQRRGCQSSATFSDSDRVSGASAGASSPLSLAIWRHTDSTRKPDRPHRSANRAARQSLRRFLDIVVCLALIIFLLSPLS